MTPMVDADAVVPRSVGNLWHGAQVSHSGVPAPATLLELLKLPQAADEWVASTFQEASIGEVAHLMADEVLSGAEIHAIVSRQNDEGRLRRPDLLEWSAMFS